ncbi:MAG: CoA-transferase [Actinomyces sp.]|nr:MAG: CoA-transferase [Actinomyces sp.]
MTDATAPRDEVCIVALAEAFRGDGEILCHPIGTVPVIAGRLARASFEPDLLLTDTIAHLVADTRPVGRPLGDAVVEGYMPFRSVFDTTWNGKRHVIMGASQIDRHGNQNIAAIGDWRRPRAQLLGLRGAPGNVINHPTSYWVPRQQRAFVERVDVVSGPGYDRMAALDPRSARFHEIRRVVTELGVYDFETPERVMRLRSIHPGVTLDEILAATPFDLVVPDEVPTSRAPTDEERRLITEVIDPDGLRHADFA